MKTQIVKPYPAALFVKVIYNDKPVTRKQMIDDIILRRKLMDVQKITNVVRKPYIIIDPQTGERYRFDSKAEKKYIDNLIERVNSGAKIELEHSSTIHKIETEQPSAKTAASYIAADHIEEDQQYYQKLKEAELKHGGPIQKLDKGTVLEGPSHENGGIQVVVNNKPVAEAEGGEVVINAENSKKYCKELSEINQRHGNGKPLICDEDDRSEFMRQGGKVELPLADLDEETMARGGLINKRMKFPKTYKPQPGKYGSGKKEPEISDYQKNKFIEKMIDEKGVDPNSYTFEEKQYLRQYSGYGGIDVEEFSSVEEAKKAMTEFYTPDAIIRKMWALAYKYGFKDGQSVLEPSVGTGEFLKYVPVQSMATGYEINKYSYSICKILYPQFDFYLQPFENVFIKNRDTIKNKLSDVKKFDLVIGNPPYGEVSGLGMGMGEKQYTNAKNWIEYFILRGLDLTLPNGLLIYIIGTEVANGGIPFLQQGNSKVKQMIAEKADLLDAYRLPNGVFDRTDVLSDILVFKRK